MKLAFSSPAGQVFAITLPSSAAREKNPDLEGPSSGVDGIQLN